MNILKDNNIIVIIILLIIGLSIISYQYIKERNIECMECVCNNFNISDINQLKAYDIIASSFVMPEKTINDKQYMDEFLFNLKKLYNTEKVHYEVKDFIPKWKLMCITVLKEE
jgi:hypothetical protein